MDAKREVCNILRGKLNLSAIEARSLVSLILDAAEAENVRPERCSLCGCRFFATEVGTGRKLCENCQRPR